MKVLQTLIADEGKTIAERGSNKILGESVSLAVNDNPENYVEIEKPIADVDDY